MMTLHKLEKENPSCRLMHSMLGRAQAGFQCPLPLLQPLCSEHMPVHTGALSGSTDFTGLL